MWHGKLFYGKSYLVVVWQSSTCKVVKLESYKAFEKIASKDSGRFFYDNNIIIINFTFIIIIIIKIKELPILFWLNSFYCK